MTGGSRETGWLEFFKCVIPYLLSCLLSCLYSYCVRTSKRMLRFSRTELDSVSLSCCIHVLFFREILQHEELRATSYCFSPAVQHLPLMSILSSHHIGLFCFSICRENNSNGRRNLPADLRIIHHSLVVATVRSGWVSSNLLIWGWNCTTTLGMTVCGSQQSGQVCYLWHAVRRPAPRLPACPPATSDLARCSQNANAP